MTSAAEAMLALLGRRQMELGISFKVSEGSWRYWQVTTGTLRVFP